MGTRPYSLENKELLFFHVSCGSLSLECVFGIMGMLDAQPYRICFSWGKLLGTPLLSQAKGFVLLFPASTCAVYVPESVSPSSIAVPPYPSRDPESPSHPLVVCEEPATLLLPAGCKALISI